MKCRKNKMSRFCGCHRNINSLIVTHLSKEDNIGALTKRSPERYFIAFCIRTHLTLAYNTLFMTMQKFQRVFQCNDMFFPRAVNLFNQTGKCCRLSTSCGTCYKNKTLSVFCKLHNLRWDTKLFWIWKPECNQTDYCCQRASLTVSRNTESS